MRANYKKPLKNCYKIEPNDDGWVTDGIIALKTKVMKGKPKIVYNEFRGTTWDNFRICTLTLVKDSMEAKPKFYQLYEVGECEGVAPFPLPAEEAINASIWVESKTGKWYTFQQAYFNWIREMEPDSYRIWTDAVMLIAIKDNEPIAFLMGIAHNEGQKESAMRLAEEAKLI